MERTLAPGSAPIASWPVKPKPLDLTSFKAPLGAALVAMETSAESARHWIRMVQRECEGLDTDLVAASLGVSTAFAAELVNPDVDPLEMLGAADQRLRSVLTLCSSPLYRAAGLMDWIASGAELRLIWHDAAPGLQASLTEQARDLGMLVTHEETPATPAEVRDVVRRVTSTLPRAEILSIELSSTGMRLSVRLPPGSGNVLRGDIPPWVELVEA